MKATYTTGTCFRFKEVGSPDAYRVPVYRNGILIAYATGGSQGEANANAILLSDALNDL